MKCETCERIRARVRQFVARRQLKRAREMRERIERMGKPPFRNPSAPTQPRRIDE
jgi:hypothetical protein